MTIPRLLLRQAHQLFEDNLKRNLFVEAYLNNPKFHPTIFWTKEKPKDIPFSDEPIPISGLEFVNQLGLGEKPGQFKLHEEGYYYCLDYSSIFAASVLLKIKNKPDCILDLCSAPGGKGIFAHVLLKPNQTIFNEVVPKRMLALISNIKRCEIKNSGVTAYYPRQLVQNSPGFFDVVLADVPCSGQSLPLKGIPAPGCFHQQTIENNKMRQRKIISSAQRLVKPGGYLAYMTCTYSFEENEGIIEWFLKRNKNFKAVKVEHLKKDQSHLSEIPCYRLWPQSYQGAGSFTCLLYKEEDVGMPEINDLNLSYRWSNF